MKKQLMAGLSRSAGITRSMPFLQPLVLALTSLDIKRSISVSKNHPVTNSTIIHLEQRSAVNHKDVFCP